MQCCKTAQYFEVQHRIGFSILTFSKDEIGLEIYSPRRDTPQYPVLIAYESHTTHIQKQTTCNTGTKSDPHMSGTSLDVFSIFER